MWEMEADGEWELWRELNSFLPRSDIPDDILNAPASWWDGASQSEVRAFGLGICTCGMCPPDRDNRPDGSGIPRYSDRHLRDQLAVADQRLGDRTTRTKWLDGYAAKLVAESRLRRGAS